MKDKIDIDKLKEFIITYYKSIKRFSYYLGVDYDNFNKMLNGTYGKTITEKRYEAIIETLNRGIVVLGVIVKPTKTINKNFFYKKH